MASIWLRWTAASTTPQRTTLVDLSRCRVLWSCGVRQNPEKGYRTRNVYFLSSGETVWIDPKYTRLIRSHRIDLNHSRHRVFDLYWTTESTSFLQFIIMLFVNLANEICRKNAKTISFGMSCIIVIYTTRCKIMIFWHEPLWHFVPFDVLAFKVLFIEFFFLNPEGRAHYLLSSNHLFQVEVNSLGTMLINKKWTVSLKWSTTNYL